MKIIPENLFDLTKEQEDNSILIYGKVVKCLIAPYHTYNEIKKNIKITKTTYLFPERDMNYNDTNAFVGMLIDKYSIKDEIKIVTTNYNIICDIVGDCVKVLTADGEIINTNVKTLSANFYDIKLNILEKSLYGKSKTIDNISKIKIRELIDRINDIKTLNIGEKNILYNKIQLIGDEIIRHKLLEMLRDKK